MKLKICFNNETHRVSKVPDTLEALAQLISSMFISQLPSNWTLEYIDSDGDKVMLADEQDYKELMVSSLDNSMSNTAIKVFIAPKLPVEEVQVPRVEVIIDDIKNHSDEPEAMMIPLANQLLKASPLEEDVESNPEINTEAKRFEEIEKIILDSFLAPEDVSPRASLETDMSKDLPKSTIPSKQDLTKPSKKKEKSQKKQKSGKKNKKAKNSQPKNNNMNNMEEMINKAIEKQVPKIAKLTQDYIAENNSDLQKNNQNLNGDRLATHLGVTCLGCLTGPITGIRYKCSICHCFDYCAKCEQTKEHPHAFIKIKTPEHPYGHPTFFTHFTQLPPAPMFMPFPPNFMAPPPFMGPPPFNPINGAPFRPSPMHCPMSGPMRPMPMPFPGPGQKFEGEPMRFPQFPQFPKPCFMEMPGSPMGNSMVFKEQANNNMREFPMTDSMISRDIHRQMGFKDSLEEMFKVETKIEVKPEPEEIKIEVLEWPNVVVERNDNGSLQQNENDGKEQEPLPMPKKFYSKATRAKAKHLQQLLPDADKEALLRFVHESPKELDLLELLENFQL